jgi:fatty-acyl-CoA synthase
MKDTVLTIPRLVERAAREHGDNDSFVFPDTRETYRELEQSSTAVARALTALGIGEGDAVGTLMPNGLDFIHTMIGTAMVGALFVPINARLAPREIAHIVPDSAMKVLFTTDAVDQHVDYVTRLRHAFPDLATAPEGAALSLADAPELGTAVILGTRTARGFITGQEFLSRGAGIDPDAVRAAATAVTPDMPYIMMYTSGTTAEPKGCALTHESVVRLGQAVGEQAFHITEADRMWNALPMFHVSAQAPMVGVLNAAATYISMTHFEPGAALELIERERATLLFPTYPTLTGPLLSHPGYAPDTFRRVRGMLTVGPPDLLRSYQDKLPHTSHVSCYGSTETGGIPVMGRLDDPLGHRLTSGRPFDGVEAEIRDPATGRGLGPGETGELHMRGFNLFLGYRNDPEKTAASFDDEGWFFTGDLASIDGDGNVTFRGRTKDMLKVGGENVGCLEVEAHLTTHPDIQLACVVGVPDPRYEEVPAAFVELRPGSRMTEGDVIAHCRTGLAKYKVPRYVRFTPDWPMSATKIQKYRLRDRLLEELERA